MARTGKLLQAATSVLRCPSLLRSRNYVLLLSHMRGYTTLVSHILGSHPEISGYAESRVSYRTPLDLLKLRCVIYRLGNYKAGCRYFLDKVLHNEFALADTILNRRNVYIVFLIREPAATLKSIVAMHHKTLQEGRTPSRLVPGTIEDAVRHYSDRLSMLTRIGERLQKSGKRAFVIRADSIIEDCGPVLTTLGAFLKLSRPLQERYSVFSQTGTPLYGDPSEFIRKGKIERERPRYGEIAVPDHVLKQGHRAYAECLSSLRDSFSAVRVQSVPS